MIKFENWDLIKQNLKSCLSEINIEFNDLMTKNKYLLKNYITLEKYLENKYNIFIKNYDDEKLNSEFLNFINLFSEIYCAYKTKKILEKEFDNFKVDFYDGSDNPDFYFMVEHNKFHVEVTNTKSITTKNNQIEKFQNRFDKDIILLFNQSSTDFIKNRVKFSFIDILLNDFNDNLFEISLLEIIYEKIKPSKNILKQIKRLINNFNYKQNQIKPNFIKQLNNSMNLKYFYNESFELYLDVKENIFCEIIHTNKLITVYKLKDSQNMQKIQLKYLKAKCECCDCFVLLDKTRILLDIFNDKILFKDVVNVKNISIKDLNDVYKKYLEI